MKVFRPKKGPFPALSAETANMLMHFLATYGRGTSIISAEGETLAEPASWQQPTDGGEVHVLTYPTTWLCGKHTTTDLMAFRRVSYSFCEHCDEVTVHHAIEQQLDPVTRSE
jgi:hypothetical protein